ncbi:MAG TPA: hypothetical protein VER03_15745 [Bryobacteraceae bacterium]|nr:hypothetical protein [Bryobacteraceae bacterium]
MTQPQPSPKTETTSAQSTDPALPDWTQPTITVLNIETVTGNFGNGPSDYSGERRPSIS